MIFILNLTSNKQTQHTSYQSNLEKTPKQIKIFIMQQKVFSHSLKKLKKQQIFQCSIQNIQKMQKQLQRQQKVLNFKPKPIKNYVQARKELISHKHSKNKIEEEVDRIMKDLVNENRLFLQNQKVNKKHHYRHYRIETEPIDDTKQRARIKTSVKIKTNQNNDEEEPPSCNQNILTHSQTKLPKIHKSTSVGGFVKAKSRNLKTEQGVAERLYEDSLPKNKFLEYIDINTAICQYRAGMTSLIKGVYHNPHNPYKKKV